VEITQTTSADEVSALVDASGIDEFYQIESDDDEFYRILTTDKTGVFVLAKK
jgi:hypothetical protein